MIVHVFDIVLFVVTMLLNFPAFDALPLFVILVFKRYFE